ncbi:SprT-like domain-containing protein [Auritidibacter ignavus]|uniref:SprT-like domain-containing protein n=1 Tax=Auritidibacter ignavus TaxID=678932 RepID=UPI0024BA0D6C|nr:SprT-like domain-containing protein [Auritidibacter ignavus]WHS28369.1 DUF45 domain-containing protein [Auritidibacter ignavus]
MTSLPQHSTQHSPSTSHGFRHLDGPFRLGRGRVAEVYEYHGRTVRIIRSLRRTRSFQASYEDGMLHIAAPGRLSQEAIFHASADLIQRLEKKRDNRMKTSDQDLYDRAVFLVKTWLNSEVVPASVRWSSRQTKVWGSCTSATGEIRLSTQLKGMPQWVIDGVLVHELVHLAHGGHDADFHRMAARYSRMDEAMAYLEGFSYARRFAGACSPQLGWKTGDDGDED